MPRWAATTPSASAAAPLRRHLRTALLLAAVALTALAMARPQWGTSEQPLTRRGIDVAIALDVSRSMTATDVTPTRAGAASRGLGNMLDHLRGDRVGLVTFAGSAFARSPLTLDLDAIRQLVTQAQGEATLVQPGTDLGRALFEALRLLDIDDPAESQVIVLVSDGEELAGGVLASALERAREAGVRVYTASAGTAQGAEIAADDAGGTELSRLDRATLERIARETGGDLRSVERIAGLAVEFARLRQSELATSEQPAPVERFQWFLGAALLALLAQSLLADGRRPASLRRGPISLGAATLIAALLAAACGGTAAYRHVADGNDAYEAGRYDDALSAYRQAAELRPDDPAIAYDIGNALHRLRRFEEATAASAAAAAATEDGGLLRRATYAVGSHAFRRSALAEARDAFISVLLKDPEDADARHNLELVLAALAPRPLAAQPGLEPDGDDGDGTPLSGPAPAPGGGEGEGEGAGSETEGESAEPAGPAPGEAGDPGQAGIADTLEAAQEALAAALLGFGEEITADEALAILDLLRRVGALAPLEGDGATAGGRLPPR